MARSPCTWLSHLLLSSLSIQNPGTFRLDEALAMLGACSVLDQLIADKVKATDHAYTALWLSPLTSLLSDSPTHISPTGEPLSLFR